MFRCAFFAALEGASSALAHHSAREARDFRAFQRVSTLPRG